MPGIKFRKGRSAASAGIRELRREVAFTIHLRIIANGLDDPPNPRKTWRPISHYRNTILPAPFSNAALHFQVFLG
ncbi:hypothetical protein PLANPX_2078 [Lacipirellula parvula]|uniref:Uncharacterized protein n=1 Tax=Lacipirellula parvula TaxID=2650471 RepID=A0A5K7XDI5_9BACT|nr:hypothetical protein PLANPX_2078 [Lacipirellula parvula]